MITVEPPENDEDEVTDSDEDEIIIVSRKPVSFEAEGESDIGETEENIEVTEYEGHESSNDETFNGFSSENKENLEEGSLEEESLEEESLEEESLEEESLEEESLEEESLEEENLEEESLEEESLEEESLEEESLEEENLEGESLEEENLEGENLEEEIPVHRSRRQLKKPSILTYNKMGGNPVMRQR